MTFFPVTFVYVAFRPMTFCPTTLQIFPYYTKDLHLLYGNLLKIAISGTEGDIRQYGYGRVWTYNDEFRVGTVSDPKNPGRS